PLDGVRADRELMSLADVVAMLVERHRVDAVLRRDVLIVGNARHFVAELAVPLSDSGIRLLTVGEPEPGASMCVEVRSLPRPAQLLVRIQERGSVEQGGLGESINRTPHVRNGN